MTFVDKDTVVNKGEIHKVINIKYLNDGVVLEQYGDWVDLSCAADVCYKADSFVTINLGVAMQLPAGFEAHLLPRSSTFKKYGLIMVNSMGVIDEAYSGDNDWWMFQAWAVKAGQIRAGERIAQFRIVEKQPKLIFNEVKQLGNPDRGGIGSTGA